MNSLEHYLIIGSTLLLLSILASKASGRFGIPSLLVFLGLGMLAGSDGIGGIQFNDPKFAQNLGVVSLIFILFSGGLDSPWESIRSVSLSGLSLSIVGVLITSSLVGWFATVFFNFSPLEGMLLGATISSTDAAAVLSVLRANNVGLKGRIKPLLEFESGSNDPMAVFLTIALIQLMNHSTDSAWSLIPIFLQQVAVGTSLGWAAGKLGIFLINRLKLEYEGLYPVLTIAFILLTFGITQEWGGSGFLAVYLAGIVFGQGNFLHKKSLLLFHDGLAWLMQIAMFLSLGLLVFPKQLVSIMPLGIALSAFLIFVARPASVFASLAFSRFSYKEKTMISWIGLRGAVPVILATYPLLAGIPKANMIFNLVFFIVLSSILLQGTSIPFVAKWLKVDAEVKPRFRYPLEYVPSGDMKSILSEIHIPLRSPAVGKALVDFRFPKNSLVVLIQRANDVFVPRGGTHIESDDTLLVLAEVTALAAIKKSIFSIPALDDTDGQIIL